MAAPALVPVNLDTLAVAATSDSDESRDPLVKQMLRDLHCLRNKGDRKKLFRHPLAVSTVPDFYRAYLAVISQPMDLGTIRDNVLRGVYGTFAEFDSDVRLVISNAFTYHSSTLDYNPDAARILPAAVELNETFAEILAQRCGGAGPSYPPTQFHSAMNESREPIATPPHAAAADAPSAGHASIADELQEEALAIAVFRDKLSAAESAAQACRAAAEATHDVAERAVSHAERAAAKAVAARDAEAAAAAACSDAENAAEQARLEHEIAADHAQMRSLKRKAAALQAEATLAEQNAAALQRATALKHARMAELTA
jgi:Bromodomain